MAEPQEAPRSVQNRRKEIIPLIVFVLLLGLVVVSTQLTGRPPEIESISPTVGTPAEVMVITGRFFHDEQGGGEVRLGGATPQSSDYLEWHDTRISIRIPDDVPSGLVNVYTRDGSSNGVLFTNRDQIPRVVSGPVRAGEPYVAALDPEKAPAGSLLTITGMNFGRERGTSEVFFAWNSPDKTAGGGSRTTENLISASERDGDYEEWGELEIRVHAPDGATSGNVLVVTERGRSNSVYFEMEAGAGTKRFADRRIYHVGYGVSISGVSAAPGNSLYLWVPTVIELPEQRAREVVLRTPDPIFEDYNGVNGYQLSDLKAGASAIVRQEFIFHRYAVETAINPSKLRTTYDTSRNLYERYTSPDSFIPSDHERIVGNARVAIKNYRNPYWKARLLYDYVRGRLSYDAAFRGDIIASFEQRKGGAYDYSVLFCALCRAVGVPSRPVSGYLVDKDGERWIVRIHYWAEYYLEGVGWVPVDPLLGDGARIIPLPPDLNPVEFYFGNLDNSHITFSKGEIIIKQQTPRGKTIHKERIGSLQTIHEEAVGSLYSYSSKWLDIQPIGVY